MSGGFFDYLQFRISEIVDRIERVMAKNVDSESEAARRLDEEGEWHYAFSEETLNQFRNGIATLNQAFVYAHRIDWLLSGDDGEEEFHARLQQELSRLALDELTKIDQEIGLYDD